MILCMKELFQHKCVHRVSVAGLTGSGGEGKTVADGTRRQSRWVDQHRVVVVFVMCSVSSINVTCLWSVYK